MKKTLVFVAVIALTCQIHLQNLQHAFQDIANMHEDILPTHFDDLNYDAVRAQYLSKLPPGPTVPGGKAYDLQRFFKTDMGFTILSYFDDITVQPNGTKGLNRYGLSPDNFLLWMAIKILARRDTNMYARSLASDRNLFIEFIQKVPKK